MVGGRLFLTGKVEWKAAPFEILLLSDHSTFKVQKKRFTTHRRCAQGWHR